MLLGSFAAISCNSGASEVNADKNKNDQVVDRQQKDEKVFDINKITAKNIDAKIAAMMLKSYPSIKVLDVRTPKEIKDGKIPDAIEIDFKQDNFIAEISNLDKNDTYLVYCRSGGRSGQCLSMMTKLGFMKVYNVTDGYSKFATAVQ